MSEFESEIELLESVEDASWATHENLLPMAAAIGFASLSAFRETETLPDIPCGPRLEAFCGQVGRMFVNSGWRNLSPAQLVEIIAHEFRQAFRLSVPVAADLSAALEQADIVRLLDTDSPELRAGFDCALPDGPWLIRLADAQDGRQTFQTLQILFSILFWRLEHRVAWWPEWRRHWRIAGPGRLGEVFAYAVTFPPQSVRELAHRAGLNIWRMSDEFGASPGACLYAIRRHVRYDFPFFLARLNFQFELDQQQMFFGERSVRAKVWERFLVAPSGNARASSSGNGLRLSSGSSDTASRPFSLEPLARFPHRDSVIEVGGFLLEAIRRQQPILVQKNRLLGIEFPSPVAVAARPNGTGTQLLVQVVPVGCHAFLMDGALRNQQQLARRAS